MEPTAGPVVFALPGAGADAVRPGPKPLEFQA